MSSSAAGKIVANVKRTGERATLTLPGGRFAGAAYAWEFATNDCVATCNDAGTAWGEVSDCGYAQGYYFSQSCQTAGEGVAYCINPDDPSGEPVW